MTNSLSNLEQIRNLIFKYKTISAKEIQDVLQISKPAVFKHLKHLIDDKTICKQGQPPRVYYSPTIENTNKDSTEIKLLEPEIIDFINENYLYVTPLGEIKYGIEGFLYWANNTNNDFLESAAEYYQITQKNLSFKVDNLIDATSQINATFEETYLDQLFYIDFYSIEKFGKTKMGQLLLYAKQSQNKKIIATLILQVKPFIDKLIATKEIDAVLFIPPTIKREVQFMTEFEKNLKLNIAKIKAVKISGELPIPQKSLTKLEDRIENAKRSIIIPNDIPYKKVLLIDDAVGSGSTLNETAAQIKSKNAECQVYALAIIGSFKGFDVVNEV